MKPQTQELLYVLMWTCEALTRPTWRQVGESFEGWAYRKGFLRQIQRLEQARLLEGRPGPDGDRLYRLTQSGMSQAVGHENPETLWKRKWDGRWRMVVFDVPQIKAGVRAKLRRNLRARGFGFLQNSVWITPDPLTNERETLVAGAVNVESLILLEARPCAGESDAEIVAGAWDFIRINRLYAEHAAVMAARPREPIDDEAAAKAMRRWLRDEREAWFRAVEADPLLPESLHPPGYLGFQSWRKRLREMAGMAGLIRSFTPAR